jgi:hypothetical protein
VQPGRLYLPNRPTRGRPKRLLPWLASVYQRPRSLLPNTSRDGPAKNGLSRLAGWSTWRRVLLLYEWSSVLSGDGGRLWCGSTRLQVMRTSWLLHRSAAESVTAPSDLASRHILV